jgi:hypothetical protein
MIEMTFQQARYSGSQALPTGSFCGAHSQGLAPTSANGRSKSGRGSCDTGLRTLQKQEMTLISNKKLS